MSYPPDRTGLALAVGVLTVLAVAPLVAIVTARAVNHGATDEQLTAARVAAYRAGLDHAARGLLDPQYVPIEQGPGRVIQLHPHEPNRKAQ
ncbi:hypothetical protein ACFQ61_01950 [Streptomyces sp. NPDC056500]|uniref:hypothetical protein n=1 Tax=Streptomyces sp. NPDC056500 TaxID=3345840 RepID=UPI0036C2498B